MMENKLPVGWQCKRLDQIADFLDGQRKPIKEGDRQSIQGEYPYYGASGIIDYINDYLFDDELILLGEDGANIVNRSSPLAFRVSGKCWINNHAHVIKPRVGTEIDFLVEYLESIDYSGLNSGTAQPKLNLASCQSIPVLIPPVEEQKVIAAVFSTWDRGIRQLTDLIAAKVRFKQGLMQQLLTGKRRLPQPYHNNDTFDLVPESILSLGLSATAVEVERGLNAKSFDEGIPQLHQRPDGWKTIRFSDLLYPVQRPLSLKPDREYQLVTAKRYRAGIVPREVLRGDQIKTTTQFEAKSGDFLISRRQIVHGACGLVPQSLDGAVVSNEYSCLRAKEELDPLFLEYFTHTTYLQRTFYQASVGVTVEKMIFRLDEWMRYEIHLPPIDEQRRIVSLLSAIDREIVLLDRQQKMLSVQKKGLMQKLLTGQIRVPMNKEISLNE